MEGGGNSVEEVRPKLQSLQRRHDFNIRMMVAGVEVITQTYIRLEKSILGYCDETAGAEEGGR